MENPIRDIETAINLCAGAESADEQINAFEHYFTTDASFLHPMCYVPPGPDSRKRVIGIFLFYRAIIDRTKFQVKTTALDPKTLHLYVDLIQTPHLRFLTSLGFEPSVPMHIHFHLRQVDDLYYIDAQEDIIQPRSLLLAIPIFRWYGIAWYFLCEVMGLLCAHIFILIGIWRPSTHLARLNNKQQSK